ncbi:hypothetical protein [Halopseudomonas oceani]|uniref:hypothetical protein n=1 Tax=Halopseudomonas oceani TaxID=1708783 RepID=UPI002AA87497|nr:hypothetical protein [Halopseudomonas oceani]
MVPTVDASFEVLVDQASGTAAHYMREAVREIDAQFGDGFAAANPGLVAAFMQTCAADFHSATNLAGLQRVGNDLSSISDSLDRVARAVDGLDIG